jgi:hypothetical protein
MKRTQRLRLLKYVVISARANCCLTRSLSLPLRGRHADAYSTHRMGSNAVAPPIFLFREFHEKLSYSLFRRGETESRQFRQRRSIKKIRHRKTGWSIRRKWMQSPRLRSVYRQRMVTLASLAASARHRHGSSKTAHLYGPAHASPASSGNTGASVAALTTLRVLDRRPNTLRCQWHVQM